MSSPLPQLTADAGFTEIADRVWVARHSFVDVNVTVVGGERGLVVVDTNPSEAAMRSTFAQVRRLSAAPLVGVVNTHEHWDHILGNALLREEEADVPVHATEEAAARIAAFAERRDAGTEEARDDLPAEVHASRVVVPDETFSSARVIDLGDRILELVHPGRGHTGGDLVVRVPDADVLLAGDLVEESATPAYGPDSFPLEWPGALDLVVGMVTPTSLVVPGHGTVVDLEFVQAQRGDVGVVAETIFDLASRRVPLEEALGSVSWPFPAETLATALRVGYDQVPRTARRLPLV